MKRTKYLSLAIVVAVIALLAHNRARHPVSQGSWVNFMTHWAPGWEERGTGFRVWLPLENSNSAMAIYFSKEYHVWTHLGWRLSARAEKPSPGIPSPIPSSGHWNMFSEMVPPVSAAVVTSYSFIGSSKVPSPDPLPGVWFREEAGSYRLLIFQPSNSALENPEFQAGYFTCLVGKPWYRCDRWGRVTGSTLTKASTP